MKRIVRGWAQAAVHLSRDPTIHFFAIAATILLIHRAVVGDPRIIVVTPALKADLVRRFQDQLGRPPNRLEVEEYLQQWKRDEALYREALREGIDRNDVTVRTVLIGKMHERAMLKTQIPHPTDADLQRYFEQHRNLFEAPLIYEHEIITIPKNAPKAEEQRANYERQLRAGATPVSLGLRTVAANVNRERIEQELGPATADQICHLPVGTWESLETRDNLLLVRMIHVEGGLPTPQVLHERLVSSWQASKAQEAMGRVSQSIADRYRFEEQSK